MVLFQSGNTVVSVATFFGDGALLQNSRRWYAIGGALLVNMLIGDASFLQWLLDVGPICQLGTIARAKMEKTQLAMNEAFAEPAGIMLAFRLQVPPCDGTRHRTPRWDPTMGPHPGDVAGERGGAGAAYTQ